jgi:hypothetical protein
MEMEDHMLWMISVSLVIFWLLGMVSGYTMGNFIHIALFFAIIAMLVQVEDDCSDDGSAHTMKRYLKRQLVNRSGKILPRLELVVVSGETVSK